MRIWKEMMGEFVVVTRHQGLVDFLIARGVINEDTPVYKHVEVEDVKGKHVLGVLPYWLAIHASTVTEMSMDLPLSLRGKELSVEEVSEYIKEPITVQVRTLEQVRQRAKELSDHVASNSDCWTASEVFRMASNS
jgi:putative CRISPR-associated protein (TIGR02620 family)